MAILSIPNFALENVPAVCAEAAIDWDKYHGRTRREVKLRPAEEIVREAEAKFLVLMLEGHRRG